MPHNRRVRPGALVIGANYRALSVVRSLGRRQIDTWVLRTDEHAPATCSRYARRRLVMRGTDAERAAQLLMLADTNDLGGWVLIPTTDEDVQMLAANYRELNSRFRVSVSPEAKLAWALDKRSCYALASRLGVEYPRTWHPTDVSALHGLEITYPVIVMPTCGPGRIAVPTPKAWRADNLDELLRKYRSAAALMPPDQLMVQEFVPGGGERQLAYAALCRGGSVLASLVAQRVRRWPREFGRTRTYVETISEQGLQGPAQCLLAESKYTGLIELEFKLDPRDGRPKLLDVNPRVWDWISIGRRAGVDFPYLLWRMLVGAEVSRTHGQRGARWGRTTIDVAAAVTERARGDPSARKHVRDLRPRAGAAFAADDPLPALVDLPLLAAIGVRRTPKRLNLGARIEARRARDARATPGRQRALIIVENCPVPADRRVWHESLSLHRAGWDVTVLAPHAWGTEKQKGDEIIEGIRIRRFALRPAEKNFLGYAGEYSEAMWRIWRDVRRLAREQPFDVIQACNPPDFLLLAGIGQRLRGTRLIFDHHDLVPEMYSSRSDSPSVWVQRVLLALERLACRLAHVSLATNESVRRIEIERDRKLPQDVFVVRNGPLLARFRPLARDPTLGRGRAHLLVYVGVMGPTDGVDHALLALSHLANRRRDWHALFLGDGEMLPELRNLTSELGLDDHVEFRGFVSDVEVRRAVCSADVCLAPDPRNCYTDVCTLVKIAEYMALSRAIVSYDLVESRLTAGNAAMFAQGNDPAEFARLIDLLLNDPERRHSLGVEGRTRIEQSLAWEHSERALLAAYRRALQR